MTFVPPSARREFVALLHATDGTEPCVRDPEAWFASVNSHPRATIAAERACLSCPARIPCLAYAQAAQEPHGVWGGLNGEQRKYLAVTG